MRDYLSLITQEHAQRPRFRATVDASTKPFAAVQELLLSFTGSTFDVDVAVGEQLDVIGRWVGASRANAVPLDAYAFTWDGEVYNGWDNGAWEGIGGFADLPDDLYRAVIKAKIIANSWKGDIPTLYKIINKAIGEDKVRIYDGGAGGPTDNFFIWDDTPENGWDSGWWATSDNGIMTVWFLLRDDIPAVEMALVTSGALPVKQAGVTAIYSTFGA